MQDVKTSTKQQIIGYLRGRDFVSGSELEEQARNWQTKSSTISRRCRELADEGKIDRMLSERRTVQYKTLVKQEVLFELPKRVNYVNL